MFRPVDDGSGRGRYVGFYFQLRSSDDNILFALSLAPAFTERRYNSRNTPRMPYFNVADQAIRKQARRLLSLYSVRSRAYNLRRTSFYLLSARIQVRKNAVSFDSGSCGSYDGRTFHYKRKGLFRARNSLLYSYSRRRNDGGMPYNLFIYPPFGSAESTAFLSDELLYTRSRAHSVFNDTALYRARQIRLVFQLEKYADYVFAAVGSLPFLCRG